MFSSSWQCDLVCRDTFLCIYSAYVTWSLYIVNFFFFSFEIFLQLWQMVSTILLKIIFTLSCLSCYFDAQLYMDYINRNWPYISNTHFYVFHTFLLVAQFYNFYWPYVHIYIFLQPMYQNTVNTHQQNSFDILDFFFFPIGYIFSTYLSLVRPLSSMGIIHNHPLCIDINVKIPS